MVRPARLPGLQGGHEDHRPGRRGAGARARGSGPSARCRSTVSTTGPRRRRSSRSTATTACWASSSRSRSASAAMPRPPPAPSTTASPTATWPRARTAPARLETLEGGEGGLGEGAERLDARDGRLVARGRQGRRPHASAPDAARAGEGHAEGRHGLHRHRQHLLGVEQLPALQPAQLDVRRHELRQLRLRLPDHHRHQGGRTRAPGHRLCRRRRLGHELRRAADLRARGHPRHRRRLQQRAVGRGEEEPGRLLRQPLRGREPEEPELGRGRPARWAPRASS